MKYNFLLFFGPPETPMVRKTNIFFAGSFYFVCYYYPVSERRRRIFRDPPRDFFENTSSGASLCLGKYSQVKWLYTCFVRFIAIIYTYSTFNLFFISSLFGLFGSLLSITYAKFRSKLCVLVPKMTCSCANILEEIIYTSAYRRSNCIHIPTSKRTNR